jgi:Fur family transcriptional regulator, ferric uptake regulator
MQLSCVFLLARASCIFEGDAWLPCPRQKTRLMRCCLFMACTAAARLVLGWLLAHPETSYTHAQLQAALSGNGDAALDRVTLYRLIDRLTQVGLLLCRVDNQRVRRYQAMPASVHATPHFECQSCHRDSPLANALKADAQDLARAAQSALEALKALGYQAMSLDLAVRGVCVDCATGGAAQHAGAAGAAP